MRQTSFNAHRFLFFFLENMNTKFDNPLPSDVQCSDVTEAIVLAVRVLTDICQYSAIVVDKVAHRSPPCQTPEL